MSTFTINSLSPEPDLRGVIIRLIRRICLLCEQGEVGAAQRLEEGELGNAVRDYRLLHGPEALPESELRAWRERESQRIADAVVLAEILIPQLTGGSLVAPAMEPPARARPPAVRPENGSPSDPAPSAGAPAIPDLLDAMLAAERRDRRVSAANRK